MYMYMNMYMYMYMYIYAYIYMMMIYYEASFTINYVMHLNLWQGYVIVPKLRYETIYPID